MWLYSCTLYNVAYKLTIAALVPAQGNFCKLRDSNTASNVCWHGDTDISDTWPGTAYEAVHYGCAEANTAVNADAYHGLQARQQALQSSLAEQSVQSSVSQYSLEQQVQSLQLDLKAVRQERDAAVSGMKALQICEERKKCSLHVGLSQVGCSCMQRLCLSTHRAIHAVQSWALGQ